jgi:hypothetical protein
MLSRKCNSSSGNPGGYRAFFLRRRVNSKVAQMGLFFYFVMFLVACGFGWWAKNSGEN